MKIIIFPKRHQLSKTVKNQIEDFSGIRPKILNNLFQVTIYILKHTRSLHWHRPHIYKMKKITNTDFAIIESFSSANFFRRYLNEFKKLQDRHRYIYVRDGMIIFVNFERDKIKISYFLPEQIRDKIKSWIKRISRNIRYIYKLRLLSSFYDNSIPLHAAGIDKNGKGYLFLGDGGSGKTTICRLSKKYCILHDDIVKAWYNAKSKRFEIYTPDNPFKKVPLKNLFFLKQSKRNKLLKLSSSQAIKEGLKSTFTFKKNYTLCDFSDSTIDLSLDLFRKIDAYRLYFKKDAAFWKLIEGLKTKRTSTGGDNERKSESKNKHNF